MPAHPVYDTTLNFLGGLAAPPSRLEARVASREGMPLLCLVEAALSHGLATSADRELVWLSDAPPAGRNLLSLRAFGADRTLLAETTHEFPSLETAE
ncbi:hypothetical protein [Phenylobacterium immobile]|uniref:hypothetical protein n=1 Tax=Phenylobacterium immobile TaxID=21 RepID=UPI000A5D4C65|nr:hypothetical protein [Phenylobacterium immobile]